MKKKLLLKITATVCALCCAFGFAACSNGNGGGGDSQSAVLDNADLLALSYDRLENADLSFNFSIDSSANAKKANKSAFKSQTTTRAGGNRTYEIVPSYYDDYVADNFDYFESQQDILRGIRDSARILADFAVDNITVMNKIVSDHGMNYIMDYENKDDVLTVTSFPDVSAGEEINDFKQIKIYYDEDGDETVEMWSYYVERINFTVHHVTRVIYKADKYYYVAQNKYGHFAPKGYGQSKDDGLEDSTYRLSVAYKSEEGWRGIQTHFDKDNPYLTGSGTYDYANGLVYLSYLIEHNGVIYTFSDNLIAYRDGKEIPSEVEASPDDEIRIQQYAVYSPIGITLTFSGHIFTINLTALKGWESVLFNGYTDREVCYDYALDSDDDVMVFSNGKTLSSKTYWSKELGWLHEQADVSAWEGANWDEIFRVNVQDMVYFINGQPEKSYSAQLCLDFLESNASSHAQVSLINDFFDYTGLSFKKETEADPIETLAYLEERKTEFTDELFEYIFKKEYSETEIKSVFDMIMSEFDGLVDSLSTYLTGFDKINFDDQPQRPTSLGLVTLSDKIKGEAKITADGMDFSGVNIEIGKSAILSNGKNYGVIVGWSNGSGTILTEAFNTAVYDFKTMSFVGKANLPLPKGEQGKYTLKCFFGKIMDDGSFIRLSEIAKVPVEKFEEFETRITAEGGYYLHKFFMEGGEAKLDVTFIDTQPPTVTVVNGTQVDNGDGTIKTILSINKGATVSDLLLKVEVVDNVDGALQLTIANISVESGELSAKDLLVDGAKYIITVTDKAGNETVKEIFVRFK